MNISNKERSHIFPINQPNTAYSFKNGFPIITFQIGAQNKLLDTNSLRLNGILRVQNFNNELPQNNVNDPDNANDRSGICLDNRIGVSSAINQITISTLENNRTLEVIRNYGRFLAGSMPVIHSADDLDTNQSVSNPCCASKSFNSARHQNTEVNFSIPLRTGLLSSGQRLPLSSVNGIRGLIIELQLGPDSNTISGYRSYAQDPEGEEVIAQNISQGANYELSNVSLTFDLLVPDEDGLSQMSMPSTGVINYNSVSQIYGVINSSDNTQSYNLGTSKTLAVHHNFIRTNRINNYNFNGFDTNKLQNSLTPANIRRVSFLRGGVKFPIDHDLLVEEQGQEDKPQSELEQIYLDSIRPYNTITNTLVSTWTNNNINTLTTPQFYFPSTVVTNDRIVGVPFGLSRELSTLPDNKPVFGVGVRLDKMSNVGVDFKSVPYSVRIVSDLDGNTPNSIYTYVLARNQLIYSPDGVAVQN